MSAFPSIADIRQRIVLCAMNGHCCANVAGRACAKRDEQVAAATNLNEIDEGH
jgi:hypothetical protein